jgi:hypothetical protein
MRLFNLTLGHSELYLADTMSFKLVKKDKEVASVVEFHREFGCKEMLQDFTPPTLIDGLKATKCHFYRRT